MAQSSRTGWTIMSGTWNHLRKVWGPTPDTLAKIQDSCKTQESLEEENVFSPTRHLLLTIKRLWQVDRVHGLPAVAASAFFPSDSRGDECWWGTQDLNTEELQRAGFHQLLSLNKNTRADCWGNKIKAWWWRGDIKTTKCRKTRECWVKSPANVPSETAKDIKEALMSPRQNYGKDSYCTVGDGSCDVRSLSMGAGFCNLNSLEWFTEKPLTPSRL